MGGTVQGCISNATQWQVKYTLRQTMLQTKNATVTTDWNVGGEITADYSKKVGVKDNKVDVDVGGKVGGKVTGGYKSNTKAEIHRIEAQGAIIVTEGSTNRAGLEFKSLPQNPRYLSIWVVHPTKGDIMMMDNLRVETQKDMRKCVWVDTNGKLKITQLAPEPKSWRFAHGCGEQRNYPVNYTCTQCGRNQRCQPGCAQKKEYGGM